MKIKGLKEKLITLAVAAVLVFAWAYFGIYCLFKRLLGIPCPGCGMTRAYLALMRLDFARAFEMHPMFWSVPILLIFYLFDGRVFRKEWINVTVLALIFAGFLINWIFKIINI
ncbi:MAG: DUF2752 domain-containing protein [Clostridia bacterium]|nr:DUF2752 domain-containing protein [Clostridia bacterium]MBQ4601922.1 DUF2752 domain-containing protein [Clostridia bacterium]